MRAHVCASNQFEYLTIADISSRLYIREPVFSNVGFPIPKREKSSTVLLHRGSLSRVDQYKYSGRLLNSYDNIRDDIFILLGNGPSLAYVNLHDLDGMHTMGLNAAYRAFERINYWPMYFGCFDALVCGHHASEFKRLIRNSPIEKFFFINFDDQKVDIFTEMDVLESNKFQKINFQYREQSEKNRNDVLAVGFDPFIDARTSGSNSIHIYDVFVELADSCVKLKDYEGAFHYLMIGAKRNYFAVNSYMNKLTSKEHPDYAVLGKSVHEYFNNIER